MKDNLYIIGFPRGMTSLVYDIVTTSIRGSRELLAQNKLIHSGEFLNPDRQRILNHPFNSFHRQYILTNPEFYTEKSKEEQFIVLNSLHNSENFLVMKDICFPQVMCEFIQRKKAKTLIINKDIPLTAYSCIQKRWFFPTRILREKEIFSNALLIKSLKYVYDEFFLPLSKQDNAIMLQAEDIQTNPNILWNALSSLGYSPTKFDYVPTITRGTERVNSYKETELYRLLSDIQ